MWKFDTPIPDDQANVWRYQLDRFVADHQESLAGLMWGLLQEWGEDSQETLGIDLLPQPHFICCSREALEKLNRQVDGKIQEILGIVAGFNPVEEVAMIAIGGGQVKLIHFKPEISPPDCFDRVEGDLDALIQRLEGAMISQIKSLPS